MKTLLTTLALVCLLVAGASVSAQDAYNVSGEVRNPGAYTWAGGTTVSAAIDAAGGGTDKFALGRSYILRPTTNKDGKPVTVKIKNLKSGTLLLPGDTFVAGRKWL
jgi:protein involved in polysaccharide export with SLBB domain